MISPLRLLPRQHAAGDLYQGELVRPAGAWLAWALSSGEISAVATGDDPGELRRRFPQALVLCRGEPAPTAEELLKAAGRSARKRWLS